MKAPRVLVVTPSDGGLGGSEIMLAQFLASSKKAGIETHTIFLEQGDQLEDLQKAGHSCEHIATGRLRNGLMWLRSMAIFGKVLLQHKPDMVIGWQSKAASYVAIPAAVCGTPFFCFHRGSPGKSLIDRASYVLPCSGFLSNSHFTAAKLKTFSKRRVAVVHSAVNLDLIDQARKRSMADTKKMLGFDPERPLIGIVGRLQRWKGMHVFLEAMALIIQKHPNCQGVVVGPEHALESDYPALLESQIRQLGLGEQVRMVGGQTNPAEWMQAMDVVVHASDEEPFGLVVAEAMALGKPVIATAPGGPAEMITDAENGSLVSFGDAVFLAKAVESFLENPAHAQRCGVNARESALQHDGAVYASKVLTAIEGLKKART